MPSPRGTASVAASCLLLALAGTAVGADEQPWGHLHVNGFATLAATYADTDGQADFRSAQFQSAGSGRSRHWDFANDSNLALQLTWDTPYEPLRVVTQAIAANDTHDDFKPRIDWLYLGWQPAPDLSIRFGRFPFPSGMYSETRWVNSSRLEVRAPQSIYAPLPVSSLDGADLNHYLQSGPWLLRSRLSYGQTSTVIASRFGDTEVDLRSVISAAFDLNRDNWRLYLGGFISDTRVTSPQSKGLHDALHEQAQSNPSLNALADDYTPDYSRVWQIDAGIEYLNAPWTVRVEGLYRNSQTKLVLDLANWNATLGYTEGRLTPFVAIGQMRLHEPWRQQALPSGPPGAIAAVAAYNASLVTSNETILSVGLRWDLDHGLALKAQLDRHQLDDEQSRGVFTNNTPEFVGRQAAIHVFTLALDYQF
ncbi:hypothetical protein OPU71_07705 [Niveibacterium sp. 24ML]|uniref:hypothetical protein n=1 Tax=Niveibacterium sp. 24ML TaxID=2985512 RepID=UPI0022709150|nr:hypothetical protein [Niveibacterium sp. 24ML]MCX9156010.1 hypothetical protein [Niveibacterium sp. 24ML]